jgi:hypothetical protein
VYAVDGVKAGVQICWELLFPWQWAQLKRDGAQVVFHVNNAVKPEDAFWEHVLRTLLKSEPQVEQASLPGTPARGLVAGGTTEVGVSRALLTLSAY